MNVLTNCGKERAGQVMVEAATVNLGRKSNSFQSYLRIVSERIFKPLVGTGVVMNILSCALIVV